MNIEKCFALTVFQLENIDGEKRFIIVQLWILATSSSEKLSSFWVSLENSKKYWDIWQSLISQSSPFAAPLKQCDTYSVKKEEEIYSVMKIVILVKTGKTSSRMFYFLNVSTFFTTCMWIENWEIEKILNNNFLSSALFLLYCQYSSAIDWNVTVLFHVVNRWNEGLTIPAILLEKQITKAMRIWLLLCHIKPEDRKIVSTII